MDFEGNLQEFRAGTSETLYVPLGTNVCIVAIPSSLFYSFGGWTGSVVETMNSLFMSVSSPSNITANFAINTTVIAGIAAAGGAVGIAATIALRRFRS